MVNRLRQAYLRLQTGWQASTQRERRLLSVTALFAALLALFILFGWLQNERQKLQRALPLAGARLTSLQAEADEYVRLQGQRPPVRLSGLALLEALRASARKWGLHLDIQAGEGELMVKGQGKANATLSWLADIMQSHALRPVRLELGREHFSATLVQATAP